MSQSQSGSPHFPSIPTTPTTLQFLWLVEVVVEGELIVDLLVVPCLTDMLLFAACVQRR
jgi:hypothetical protein